MREPIPRTSWSSLENVWNALVQQMQLEPGGMEDIEAFLDYCHAQLRRVSDHHRGQANPPKGHRPGYAKRMRHLGVVATCDEWLNPSEQLITQLMQGAHNALDLARSAEQQREVRAFALAEMKLCLLFADACIADVGLQGSELRALEQSCTVLAANMPAVV